MVRSPLLFAVCALIHIVFHPEGIRFTRFGHGLQGNFITAQLSESGFSGLKD